MPGGICRVQPAGRASAGFACEAMGIGFNCGMTEELTEAGGKTRPYVTGDLGEGVALALDEGQAHYLLHVLRAKTGNLVSLFNGRDGEGLPKLPTTKRGVPAPCRKLVEAQHGVPDIWLAFAPVKKTPSDYLVQKAVELGAAVLQ